ncbi:MAG: hypothetical protein ACREQJ_15950, partial [Candidatus Binatia bacterium]
MRRRSSSISPVSLDALDERLRRVLEGRTRLVLVHSSLDRIAVRLSGSKEAANPISAAAAILRTLARIVGPEGTLAMPTHPRYPHDDEFLRDHSDV